MGTATRTDERLGQYAFIVRDLSGGLEAYFRDAQVPKVTFEKGEIREGGSLFPVKEATIGNIDDITLNRGLVPSQSSLWDWLTESGKFTAGMPFGKGVRSPNNLRNISIDQLRRDRSKAMIVKLYNCQALSWQPGGFDNMSSDIQVETLVFCCEGMDIEFK
jgi:phage tail-like protein